MSTHKFNYLSKAEVEKIKEEVAYRESVIRSLSPTKWWQAFLIPLITPAIITMFGGIILACLGQFFQQINTKEKLEYEHQKSVQDKKISILSALPSQIHKDFTLLYNRVNLRAFLYKSKDKRNVSNPLGLNRNEIKKHYEKLVSEDITSHSPIVMLTDIKIWYCDPKVITLANRIDVNREKLENLKPSDITDKILDEYNSQTETQLRDLTQAMANELRERRDCGVMMTKDVKH